MARLKNWLHNRKPRVEFENMTMFVEEGTAITCHKTNIVWHETAKAIVITPAQKKRVDRLFNKIMWEISHG